MSAERENACAELHRQHESAERQLREEITVTQTRLVSQEEVSARLAEEIEDLNVAGECARQQGRTLECAAKPLEASLTQSAAQTEAARRAAEAAESGHVACRHSLSLPLLSSKCGHRQPSWHLANSRS